MALQKVGAPAAPNAAQRQAATDAKMSLGTNNDSVIRPNHYAVGGLETIDILKAKMTPEEFAGFCKGNIIKYITRAKHKNGLEDIKKARQYCDFLISVMEDKV